MREVVGLVVLASLLLVGRGALAQSGFELSWWTVDSGGGAISGSGYSLSGTPGQSDAGVLTGGAFTLVGGFWCGGAPAVSHQIFLPLVLRN